MVAITLEHELTLMNKLFSCLSMSTSFCFGIMYLARFETQGDGIQWQNIWQSPMAEDTMNFGNATLMMMFDALLYFLIGWYISNVFPSTTYGKQPWYFFLLPSYWGCGACPSTCPPAVESATDHRGMSVHNLHVIYNAKSKHEYQAVCNLSLQLREGEIGTLLGKNGAGKTSTISVLTGTLAPTSGFVYVYGSELQRDYQRARRLLGYCPQYNVLFAHMTVREHLQFFSRLKDVLPEEEIEPDVDRMLVCTGLLPMQHQLASRLSGGLQRRLCVALAFVGGSKLIILDEPTASVDPLARRQIWDLIVQQKRTRTVLLTTHHMDEADILSDQVAIIHQGRLLCSGSPLLLKSKFGCGYRLTVSKHKAKEDGDMSVNGSSSSSASSTSSSTATTEQLKVVAKDGDDKNVMANKLSPSSAVFDEDGSQENMMMLMITDSDSGRVSNNSAATSSPTAATKNQIDLAPFEPLKSFGPVKKRFAELERLNRQKAEQRKQFQPLPRQSALDRPDTKSSDQPAKLMQFINCLIPNAVPLEEGDGQLLVALPSAGVDGQSHDYSTFFCCLDANLARFGFHSYGLSSTTLEEVFLALCALQEANLPLSNTPEAQLQILKHLHSSNGLNNLQSLSSPSPPDSPSPFSAFQSNRKFYQDHTEPIGFVTLKFAQFRGLLLKRAYHTFTNWRTLFYNLILPCVFIAFAMGMTTIKPSLAPDPILPLNPSIYGSEATSFFALKMDTFADQTASTTSHPNSHPPHHPLQWLEQQLAWSEEHFVSDCASPRPGWKVAKCPVVKKSFYTEFPQFLRHFKEYEQTQLKAGCECSECDQFVYSGAVPEPTGTRFGYVYNLSSVDNLRSFLLRTYSLFNDRRYGGWTLHSLPSLNMSSHGSHDPHNWSGSEELTLAQNDNVLLARSARMARSAVSLPTSTGPLLSPLFFIPPSSGRSVVKVWFDNNGWHAIPGYVNALSNALLRSNLARRGMSPDQVRQFSIQAYSQPFHIRSAQLGDQNLMQKAGDAGIALIILVGFSFIPISFAFYLVRERMNEEKQMQRMLGVGTWLYWSCALIWDMLMICAGVLACALILWLFHLPIYTTRMNLPAILLLLLLFGWAMCGAVHLLEKLFTEPSIAFMVIYCATLFVGIHTMLLRLLVDVFQLLQVNDTFRITCERLALIFPPFALMSGLVDITKNHLLAELYLLVGQDVYVNPFSMRLLGIHYLTLSIEGAALMLLNLLFELYRNGDLWFLQTSVSKRLRQTPLTEPSNGFPEDEDVAEERRRILTNGLRPASMVSSHVRDGRGSLAYDKEIMANPMHLIAGNHAKPYETNKYQAFVNDAYVHMESPTEPINKSFSLKRTTPAMANGRNEDILRVVNVSKEFRHPTCGDKGRRRAVDRVTFGLRRGECFGLLGVNGAGKTTLFRMLTGQLRASGGLALVGERQISELLAGTCTQLGYCPQADALDCALTPRQHLTIYATLRGLGSKQRSAVVKQSLQGFQLTEYEHFPVQTLSRGNRRKLCLAIAMLGNPQIMLLVCNFGLKLVLIPHFNILDIFFSFQDEPTSGMDPMSRRCLWFNIQAAVRQKRSVLLTSHRYEMQTYLPHTPILMIILKTFSSSAWRNAMCFALGWQSWSTVGSVVSAVLSISNTGSGRVTRSR